MERDLIGWSGQVRFGTRIISVVAGQARRSLPSVHLPDPTTYTAWEVGTWAGKGRTKIAPYMSTEITHTFLLRLFAGEKFSVVCKDLNVTFS